MSETRRAVVFADHGQFYLQDVEAHDQEMRSGGAMDPDRAPAGWTHEAVHMHRIGVEPHSISVGTARSDFVETSLELHETPPPELPQAEHIVEADVQIPTGELSIYGCTEDPGPEHRVNISAGRYRVRVSYVPSDPPEVDGNPDEPGDYFRYPVEIWPATQPAALVVVRQGPSPWAG